jgi:hypothetical protein
VDAAEIGCVDWPKRFVVGGPNLTRVDEFGDSVQERTLLLHVQGPKHGAGEHEGPVERGTLALEQADVDRIGVFHNANNMALGFNHLGHGRTVLIGVSKIGNVVYLFVFELDQLGG